MRARMQNVPRYDFISRQINNTNNRAQIFVEAIVPSMIYCKIVRACFVLPVHVLGFRLSRFPVLTVRVVNEVLSSQLFSLLSG